MERNKNLITPFTLLFGSRSFPFLKKFYFNNSAEKFWNKFVYNSSRPMLLCVCSVIVAMMYLVTVFTGIK